MIADIPDPSHHIDVDLSGFALHGIHVTVTPDDLGWRIRASINPVRAIDFAVVHGDVVTVKLVARVVPHGSSRAEIARAVREQVITVLTHEVDEWIRVDGRLVSNAHPESGDVDCWLGAEAT
jgi:hypothetical protein